MLAAHHNLWSEEELWIFGDFPLYFYRVLRQFCLAFWEWNVRFIWLSSHFSSFLMFLIFFSPIQAIPIQSLSIRNQAEVIDS